VAWRNDSPASASVLTRLAYPAGDLISLILHRAGMHIEFFGSVAWCRAASDAERAERDWPLGIPLFLVGLQLRGAVRLAAALDARAEARDR